MKRRILLVALLFLFSSMLSYAQTLVLPGDGALKEAISAAADGDVLQLLGGAEYTESTDLTIGTIVGKKLTIEAEPGALDKPVVKITRVPTVDEIVELFEIGDQAALTLKGIILDGATGGPTDAENLIQLYMGDVPAATNIQKIKILDCEVKNFTNNVIDGMSSSFASYIIVDSTFIDNCVFTNTGTVIQYKYAGSNFISITNSTFNTVTSYGLRIAGPGYTTFYDNTPRVIVDRTTWHNIGTTDPREILLLEKGPNLNRWTVTNNIFSLQLNKDKTCVNLKETDGDSLATVISNAFWEVGVLKWNKHHVVDTLTIDPQFADAANGDFTIPAGHTLLTFGIEGSSVGDPRWAIHSPKPTDVENETVPEKFNLSQNYPNPFNPTTKINFDLPESELVTLSVYDILGREVAVIVNEKLSAGTYSYQFNANDLPSGVYVYKLIAGSYSVSRKMVLTK